ncbi:MAG: TonB-dependent receptor plug domain-containing protein, partial [Bacteroidales bacterium]|nr:TonB-dependent receptor plug domain-containing protein [Bacteroidales bacterium]
MKKSDCFFPSCKKTGGKALLLLLMMWVLPGIASVVAQEKIDINIKNGALTDVFKAVQNQTEYRFMYSTEDVKSYQGITMEMKGASLKDVMGTALAKTDLEWHIENQIVFIKKKADKAESVKQIRITGRVTDVNNNPIPGVTVLLEGTSMGAATDANGEYVLTLPEQKSIVLIYSFVGMVSERVVYSGQTKINVILKEDVKTMEEVVVTGYQTMRKSDVVGSMTTVKASDVMMPAYSSIDQMLQGRVAGMMVMNTSSRVGTSPKIRIRGTSTILGNQDPLWVVDGVIQPDPLQLDQNDIMVDDLKNILGNQISWLNPADIETITVLKDASATAIYGSKAANGVIVITTKRG